jgi:two-component system, NarL family, nitrate/nitrite response regulator NarL
VSDAQRVLLADDHAPTRGIVREALEEQGFDVVADVDSAQSAIAAAQELRPDVCLLDIHMPGGGGIAAAAEISQLLPETPIVMLTASQDDRDLFAALRAGASGYLVKGMDPDRIGPALQSALAGEIILPKWLVKQVVEEFQPPPRRRLQLPHRATQVQLTEREAEILDLMVEGQSTEDMAKKLFVAQVTVRSHIAAVLKKLQVKDRESAVRLSRQGSERPENRFDR